MTVALLLITVPFGTLELTFATTMIVAEPGYRQRTERAGQRLQRVARNACGARPDTGRNGQHADLGRDGVLHHHVAGNRWSGVARRDRIGEIRPGDDRIGRS